MTAKDKINKEDKKLVIAGVWAKHFTTKNLPEHLYRKTGKQMESAVKKGYKVTIKMGGTDRKLIQDLTDNVWFFSAAKTYQQVRGMEAAQDALDKQSKAFLDEDGESISKFKAFRDGYYTADGDFVEGASQIFDTYNEDWLQSEYTTAINKAYLASRWQNIQENKDVLPYLQRDEIDDMVECEDCAEINGMVVHADNPLLDEYYDGLHFNCRGNWQQLDEEEGSSKEWSDEDVVKTEEGLTNPRQPMFKMNPGKDRVVFKTDGPNQHPYFDVAKGDKELKANNFNLPRR